jgi:integrase/recombinase XerD
MSNRKNYDYKKFVGIRHKGNIETGETNINYTFDEALDTFVVAKDAEGVRPRTIHNYYEHMEYLLRYLNERYPECVFIHQLTSTMIRDYTVYLKNERQGYTGVKGRQRKEAGLSYNTINIRLRTLKTMCGFWIAEEMITTNPMKNIKQLRLDEDHEVNGFSKKEIKRLLNTPDKKQFAGWRDYVLMILLLDTGLRVGEAVKITINDVDEERRLIYIPSLFAKSRKGRFVPVSLQTLNLLRRLNNETEDNFPGEIHFFMGAYGEPLTTDTFRRRMWGYGKKLGIKKCNPHKFRHSFCRDYILNGGDIFTLQKIVGHSDISTTRKYIQMDYEHMSNQHTKFSPVSRYSSRRRVTKRDPNNL